MEIIVGTSEHLLLAYKLEELHGVFSLKLSFTDDSHTGYVKSIAVSSKGILASGSSDESINLFHLTKRKRMESILFHQGSINCLQFFESSHLFTASEDGKIAIWKVGSWERLKVLRGHTDAVFSFSVHPSGKLGLSVSKDKTLHAWDLTRGRRGFVINTKQVPDIVTWSPDGSNFVIVSSNLVDIYVTETAAILHQISLDFKVSSVAFITSDILAVGGFGGIINFYEIKSASLISRLETNTNRVKSMVSVKGDQFPLLVAASSDGFIKVYKLTIEDSLVSGELLTEADTKFRILCCTVHGDISSSDSLPSSIDEETKQVMSADAMEEETKKTLRQKKLKMKKKLDKLKARETIVDIKKSKKDEMKEKFKVKKGKIEKSKTDSAKKEKKTKLKKMRWE